MPKPTSLRHLLHTALLLLVLCGAGQVHNHVCLDGSEPPSLVHFENFGGHPEHPDDEVNHADVEKELMPELLLTKSPNLESPLIHAVTALLLSERNPPQRPYIEVSDERIVHHQPADLLPPSQAPPSRAA